MIEQIDQQPPTPYDLAYLLISHLDDRLHQNYHLRDCDGQVIFRLDEWLVAVAAGRWPVGEAGEQGSGGEGEMEYCPECGEKVEPVPGGNGVCEICWSEGNEVRY